MKIGYQGISGAYSEMAGDEYVKMEKLKIKKVELVGCKEFEEIFEKIESGEFEYGVIPVENSLAGSIHKNFDLLGRHNLKVVGEVYVHVNHQLLVLPGTKKEEVKEVYSHYQALAQCEHNLKEYLPLAKVVEYFDTAAASELIKKANDKTKAAISSAKAGKMHGLKVLQKDFQDDKNNFTRFLVINKNYLKFVLQQTSSSGLSVTIYKTSIIFAGGNVAGFLFKALACFSLRDIDLLKIESRPVPKSPWEYYFYLDFAGKYDDENVKNAINNLREIAKDVKILGSYKKSVIN